MIVSNSVYNHCSVGEKILMDCHFCNFRKKCRTIITVTKLLFKSNFPNPNTTLLTLNTPHGIAGMIKYIKLCMPNSNLFVAPNRNMHANAFVSPVHAQSLLRRSPLGPFDYSATRQREPRFCRKIDYCDCNKTLRQIGWKPLYQYRTTSKLTSCPKIPYATLSAGLPVLRLCRCGQAISGERRVTIANWY